MTCVITFGNSNHKIIYFEDSQCNILNGTTTPPPPKQMFTSDIVRTLFPNDIYIIYVYRVKYLLFLSTRGLFRLFLISSMSFLESILSPEDRILIRSKNHHYSQIGL